jgi:hypothetical protein
VTKTKKSKIAALCLSVLVLFTATVSRPVEPKQPVVAKPMIVAKSMAAFPQGYTPNQIKAVQY